MTKPKIKAILPLSSNQQSFLLHSLQNEQSDSGIILVKVDLVGNLNVDLFETAWKKTIHRHDALRTSIHWKKIKKPVQVIHENAKTPLAFLDWSSLPQEDFEKKIETLKKENSTSLNLTKAPVSNILLVKQSDSKHKMFWFCHHILLDGWSSSIIIKDLLAYYDSCYKGIEVQLDPLPTSKSYFNWLQSQEEESAKIFWNDYLGKLETPHLFKANSNAQQKAKFKNFDFPISQNHSDALISFSQKNRMTVNTLLLGMWGLLQHSFFDKKNIVFGNTVSGRTAPLDNLHLAAGLFMNVLPVTLEIDSTSEIKDWFKKIQTNQAKTLKFEHNTLNQIYAWVDSKHAGLFDSLILFENFPFNNIKGGELEVQNFRSGITTNYPLTLIVIPRAQYEFHFQYDSNIIDKKTISWFAKQIENLIIKLVESTDLKIGDLLASMEAAPVLQIKKETKSDSRSESQLIENYVAPQNNIELQLTKIWESLLSFSPIGVTDNFFEIGGQSLQAVRLLSQIERNMSQSLPPISLIENPTIGELASLLSGEKMTPSWSYFVPLRTVGNNPPLFCLHAGGGHTFFYYPLVKYLDEDQPIYAVQPFLSNVKNKLHGSIEIMAEDYLKNIRAAYPEGPYIFLVYCFSITLGIEMIRQLEKIGITNASLIIIDTLLPASIGSTPTTSEKLKKYWKTEGSKKIGSLIIKKIKKIPRKIGRHYSKKIKPFFKTDQDKTLSEMASNLQKIHFLYHWKKEWKPVKSKVTYIQRIELKGDRGLKKVERFNNFFVNDVEVYTVSGQHQTLFEEPEIKNLAKVIQLSLDHLISYQKSQNNK